MRVRIGLLCGLLLLPALGWGVPSLLFSAPDSACSLPIPVTNAAEWQYHVRVWCYDHNPLWDEMAPEVWHELTDDELQFNNEQRFIDLPATAWREFATPPEQTIRSSVQAIVQHAVQIASQARDVAIQTPVVDSSPIEVLNYLRDLFPLAGVTESENWQCVNGSWYLHVQDVRVNSRSIYLVERVMPFFAGRIVPTLAQRTSRVDAVTVIFHGQRYPAVRMTVTAPDTNDPILIVTEVTTTIEGLGVYKRVSSVVRAASDTAPAQMLSKRIWTLR